MCVVKTRPQEKKMPLVSSFSADKDKYTPILKPPASVLMRSGFVQLAVGQEIGRHSTEDNEEMLIILKGRGNVEIEGYPLLKVKGGKIAYVPPRTYHNVSNTGSAMLKYIFVVSKAIGK